MKLEGIITAMVTPFNADQSINYKATERHIDHLISNGVDGLFILGTNGEFHVLSHKEKLEYARFVVDYVDHRVPVYVGTGECGTEETIHFSKAMEAAGADAFSVITPYLVKVSQAELIDHYTAIADAVSTPIIMYNIPANTGITLEAETVAALSQHPNIVGIKDSSGNVELLSGYCAIETADFSVLVGSDSKILTGLKLGAKGAVASTTNAIPKHVVTLYNAFKEGHLEEAERLQKDIDVLRGVLKLGSVPSVIKRCVTLLGNDVGDARLPVSPLGQSHDVAILDALRYYGLVD